MTAAARHSLRSGVARIVLSAPASQNAFGDEVVDAVSRGLDLAESDASCRAVVISAEGAHFCRGLDIDRSFAGGLPREQLRRAADCLKRIVRCPRPVIACVGLVAACDLVLATGSAVFMLPEAFVGMIPALVTPFLARRLTPGRIRYMVLSTRGIPAAEAHQIGLADEVVTGSMTEALDRQLKRLFRASPAALAECKAYFDTLGSADLDAQVDLAFDRLMRFLEAPEVVDGIRTFAAGGPSPWSQPYRSTRDV
jgi:enoyl-CoA hydratase/carnithine racemase